jgi:hypothetical protein
MRAGLARVLGYERLAGEIATMSLRARAHKTAALPGIAVRVMHALSASRFEERTIIAQTLLGWIADTPRAQMAVIQNGYALHAGVLAAGCIDAAAALVYWCGSDEQAAEWVTHASSQSVPFSTAGKNGYLENLSRAVASALPPELAVLESLKPEALSARWRAHYAASSQVKHANPITLRPSRQQEHEDGLSILSGPGSGPERIARASADVAIAEEMFFAASLAAAFILDVPSLLDHESTHFLARSLADTVLA